MFAMAQFQQSKWVGVTLDLKNMFFSIPINDPEGILNMCIDGIMYRWTVCPQGYRNTPSLATGAMNNTLKSFKASCSLPPEKELKIWSYIDDITIMGHDSSVVTSIVNQLVTHLQSEGWTINEENSCLQPVDDITFLGTRYIGSIRHRISHEGPNINPLKIFFPTTKLLGHLNWYRHYIEPSDLALLNKLQRQICNKSRKSTPWTKRDQQNLLRLLATVKDTQLHAINLGESLTVTLRFTTNHVWAVAHNPHNELVYTAHKTLQAAQHRYGAIGKILLAEQLVEPLTRGHGTLRTPGATLLPLLDAGRVDLDFQGESKTWNTLVLTHHYNWHCWRLEDMVPDPSPEDEEKVPTLYGTSAPAWMASDGTSQHGGGYGYYCKACNNKEIFQADPDDNSAQRCELLGFLKVLEHCLTHHNDTLPVPIIAIDSQYIYKILTGTAFPSKNLNDWQDIWETLTKFVRLPLIRHTKSHRPDTDPVHEVIDKLLENPLRTDIVLPVTSTSGPEVNPFLMWLHENWGHPGPRACHQRWCRTLMEPASYGARSDWEKVAQACEICAKEKCHRTKHQLGAFDSSQFQAGKVWQVDLLGPLPGSKLPNKGLVVVDLGTRQLQVIPLRKSNATAVISALTAVFATWQPPHEIQSDGGPPFNSNALDKFTRLHNIAWHLHLPYHLQSNGVVERHIGLYKEQLCLRGGGTFKNWTKFNHDVLISLNTAKPLWDEANVQKPPPWEPKFQPDELVWISILHPHQSHPQVHKGTVQRSGQYPNTYSVQLEEKPDCPPIIVHHNRMTRRSNVSPVSLQ
ncbi:uncharacterized protein LOC132252088 [Alligator mississippiensis]|uniref:uncharacterized protein LOC132252088 n=1 Tax=Alligator mississippiensis TaxID=8496 RepID=UPI00287755AD|nr:uncharacterized protein LOC132252088 [Alligator mississippiensis]XP_059588090.1 uncharacterized protein LOC132252088 [Alligator mississippiensis]XP_059588092.1 uncharacterized protein LOC132252088 [Alligator mississippiensis]